MIKKLYVILEMWIIVMVGGRKKIQWCNRAWYMVAGIKREVLVMVWGRAELCEEEKKNSCQEGNEDCL